VPPRLDTGDLDDHERNPARQRARQNSEGKVSDKLLFSSIDELHASYKAKEVSPVKVLEAVLERIDALEPRLNAFVTLLPEEAREQASRAEDLFSKGEPTSKLTGIPVSVKDIFMTEGAVRPYDQRRTADGRPPPRDGGAGGGFGAADQGSQGSVRV
jgi:Amidase